MTDYKELYFTLFRELSKVASDLENHNYGNAERRLKTVQQEAEERFLQMEDEAEAQ